nr:tRNA lysidine(34) synthetase TilS [uncultured Sphaerochaeta sp.]
MPTIDAIVPKTIQDFLISHHIPRDMHLAVAFSGGSDSLALLIGLSALFPKEQVSVFYVNHRLRSEQELSQELQLCLANCQRLGYGLEVLDLGKGSVEARAKRDGEGIEAAARTLRYEALYAACRNHGCAYLATAHNADDQIETLLMRLFQAASVSSLKGAAAFTQSPVNATLIRPLLTLPHRTLRAYVEAEAFQWAEDTTNEQDAYLRNKIRHTIKPQILALFPNAYDAVSIMSRRFSDIAGVLQTLEDEALSCVKILKGEVRFSLDWYKGVMPQMREGLLYRLYAEVCSSETQRIRQAMIARLQEHLDASTTSSRLHIEAGGSIIMVSEGWVVWIRETQYPHYLVPLLHPGEDQEIFLPGGIVFRIDALQDETDTRLLRIDADSLDHAVIRSAEDGDWVELEAGRVSVSKLLSSYRIPKSKHPTVPLLCDRSGVVAVFARMYGGRDRLARRFKAPLARRLTNIYSSRIKEQ